MTETAEHIAELRHQCALNGPCSDYTDGCGCTDSQLVVRAFRKNLAEVKAAMTETVSDMNWFELRGDARLGRCATDGCGGQPTLRLEAGGVGSNYCSGCAFKIKQLVHKLEPADNSLGGMVDPSVTRPRPAETVSDERLRELAQGYETWGKTNSSRPQIDKDTAAALRELLALRAPQNTDGEAVAGLVKRLRSGVPNLAEGWDIGMANRIMSEAASLLSTLKAELADAIIWRNDYAEKRKRAEAERDNPIPKGE